MIGMVLAAGAGRRLRPYTDTLPKALVPVIGEDSAQPTSILDLTLANFAEVGLTDVVVIVGYRAEAVTDRQAALEKKYGVSLELVFNDKAETWNNAYSLWCAREHFARGFLLANGDTVHPVSVERTLLDHPAGPEVLLAVDQVKPLADEEMKVQLSADGGLTRITKLMDPATAAGEYIGLTLVAPAAADQLADALETTFTRDPDLYYEDGYQELVDRGVRIDVAPIGTVDWVEVDDHADLAKARTIAVRY